MYKKGQDLRSMEEQKDMNTVSADTEVKEAAAGAALQAEAPAAAPDAAQKAEKRKKRPGSCRVS